MIIVAGLSDALPTVLTQPIVSIIIITTPVVEKTRTILLTKRETKLKNEHKFLKGIWEPFIYKEKYPAISSNQSVWSIDLEKSTIGQEWPLIHLSFSWKRSMEDWQSALLIMAWFTEQWEVIALWARGNFVECQVFPSEDGLGKWMIPDGAFLSTSQFTLIITRCPIIHERGALYISGMRMSYYRAVSHGVQGSQAYMIVLDLFGKAIFQTSHYAIAQALYGHWNECFPENYTPRYIQEMAWLYWNSLFGLAWPWSSCTFTTLRTRQAWQ